MSENTAKNALRAASFPTLYGLLTADEWYDGETLGTLRDWRETARALEKDAQAPVLDASARDLDRALFFSYLASAFQGMADFTGRRI